MKVKVIGPRDGKNATNDDGVLVYTVSKAKSWSRGLSPFFLGPCKLYDGHVAKNVENAWQFAKVYKRHMGDDGNPTNEYFEWAKSGWSDAYAHRYPMGKGTNPEYSWWNGEKLDYIEARKKIYVPLYYNAVRNTEAYARLKHLYQTEDIVYLWDFDGWDNEKRGMTLKDVINDPSKPMGHAFVLMKMLQSGA